jgi:hypothetical protein
MKAKIVEFPALRRQRQIQQQRIVTLQNLPAVSAIKFLLG